MNDQLSTARGIVYGLVISAVLWSVLVLCYLASALG